MATIKDVAKAAGVSTATVSYVLNNSAPISEQTRQRVLEAVARLGYRPSITARNLQASESRIVGYSWHSKDAAAGLNFILARFIHCVATTVEAHNYHLLTFTQEGANILDVYAELIETGRVDGFVLSETNLNDPRIHFLINAKFPFVAFGRANPDWDFPYVDVDGEKGMRKATEHLLALGHRRIAFLGWPEGSIAGDTRYAGYCAALQSAGIDVDPQLVRRGQEGAGEGWRLAHELLSLPQKARPTAIVAVSDMVAIGAMNALQQQGVQVGRDMAVIGFDNVPLAEYLHPPLSSVSQPIEELAQTLIHILMCELNGEPCPKRQVLVEPELVIRESSGQAG